MTDTITSFLLSFLANNGVAFKIFNDCEGEKKSF